MTYQERIRGLREDWDLTQTEVAKHLGVAQTTYSQYELGKRPLPLDFLTALCLFYRVSADYILGLPQFDPPGTSKGTRPLEKGRR